MIKVANNLQRMVSVKSAGLQWSGTLADLAKILPYTNTAIGGGLGALGGSAIGGLIQALRGKSILKGLGYGGLAGLGLGGGVGLYGGLKAKNRLLDDYIPIHGNPTITIPGNPRSQGEGSTTVETELGPLYPGKTPGNK